MNYELEYDKAIETVFGSKQKYNKKAIEAVFGSKQNMAQIVGEVLSRIEDDVCFDAAMGQFLEHFHEVASEFAATEALGVDMVHHRERTDHPMTSSIVQCIIDEVNFKERDRVVNHLFEEINNGDYISAYQIRKVILGLWGVDVIGLTEDVVNEYLVRVYRAKWPTREPFDFSCLGQFADAQRLYDKLQEELPVNGATASQSFCTQLALTETNQ